MKNLTTFFVGLVAIAISFPTVSGSLLAQTNNSNELSRLKSNWENSKTQFLNKYQNPKISVDNISGAPQYIVAGDINVSAGNPVTSNNVVDFLQRFIDDNYSFFKFKSTDLRLVQNDYVNNKFHITFAQYYNGVKVINSKVNFTVFPNGAVPAIKMNYFPNISISVTPSQSFHKAAQTLGITSTNDKDKLDLTLSSETACVLPIKISNKYIYKLIYPIAVKRENVTDNAIYYVDAHSLETLKKISLVNDANTTCNVKASVKKSSPFDTPSLENLENIEILYNTKVAVTDSAGLTDTPVNSVTPINLYLKGPSCKILTENKNLATIPANINPGVTNKYVFDSTNSDVYERMVYYHFQKVKDFHLRIDTNLKCLKEQFLIKLEYVQSKYFTDPNAFSSGSYLGFVNLQNKKYRMPEVPEILYHEYGHSVNSLFYTSKNASFRNYAANEAIADVTAAWITGNSKCGIGYRTDSTQLFVRDLQNTRVYPNDIKGESHYDGQILSGAFWDLAKVTSLDYMGKIMHFSRYQLPDDEDTGKAFFEWLLAALIEDDDDGNLNNGGPHFNQIIKAFGDHGIDFNIIYPEFFVHTPVTNQQLTNSKIKVDFKVITDKYSFLHTDSTFVYYKCYFADGDSTKFNRIVAEKTNDNQYYAQIPGQPAGTIVEYYLGAYDSYTKKYSYLYNLKASSEPFRFFVGFKRAKLDNLENPEWQCGDMTDRGSNDVIWTHAKPKGINDPIYGYLRPDSDYSEIGEKCYVSGNNTFTGKEYNDICPLFPVGDNSLITTEYNINALKNPIVQFKYFFNNFANFGKPTLGVFIKTPYYWDLVKYLNPCDDWNNSFFRIKDFVDINTTTNVQIKFLLTVQYFTINDDPTHFAGSIGSALIDDFELLTVDEIYSVGDAIGTNNTVRMSPNPFEETIRIDAVSKSATPQFSLYNYLGEKVFESVLPVSNDGTINYTLNLKSLNGISIPAGAYFYSLQSGEEIFTGKIIKR